MESNMLDNIDVQVRTQRLVIQSQQRLILEDRNLNVVNEFQGVAVVNAGPQGPGGIQGVPGPPGNDADTQIEVVMQEHVDSPTPHPAYDDIPDLTVHFENGLY